MRLLEHDRFQNLTIPVEKARDFSNRAKHRPVSLLSLLSKVFDQFSNYPNDFLNKIVSDFRKAHCTWYAPF